MGDLRAGGAPPARAERAGLCGGGRAAPSTAQHVSLPDLLVINIEASAMFFEHRSSGAMSQKAARTHIKPTPSREGKDMKTATAALAAVAILGASAVPALSHSSALPAPSRAVPNAGVLPARAPAASGSAGTRNATDAQKDDHWYLTRGTVCSDRFPGPTGRFLRATFRIHAGPTVNTHVTPDIRLKGRLIPAGARGLQTIGRPWTTFRVNRPFRFHWGERVRMQGAGGRVAVHLTPPAWSRIRSR